MLDFVVFAGSMIVISAPILNIITGIFQTVKKSDIPPFFTEFPPFCKPLFLKKISHPLFANFGITHPYSLIRGEGGPIMVWYSSVRKKYTTEVIRNFGISEFEMIRNKLSIVTISWKRRVFPSEVNLFISQQQNY